MNTADFITGWFDAKDGKEMESSEPDYIRGYEKCQEWEEVKRELAERTYGKRSSRNH